METFLHAYFNKIFPRTRPSLAPQYSAIPFTRLHPYPRCLQDKEIDDLVEKLKRAKIAVKGQRESVSDIAKFNQASLKLAGATSPTGTLYVAIPPRPRSSPKATLSDHPLRPSL